MSTTSESGQKSPGLSDRVKHLIWTMAGHVYLSGLCTWEMRKDWLRIERPQMPLKGLGEGFPPTTLVHLSDMHCSPICTEDHLLQYVRVVNSLQPDFVAITGDFITTGPRPFARGVGRVLRELRPKVAVLACLGNHDYGIWHPNGLGGMRGLGEYVTNELAEADVFVLNNEIRRFEVGGSSIQFVGMHDLWSPAYDPKAAFEFIDPSQATIALCHNPDAAPLLSQMGADWVLSGHTHGKPTPQNRLNDWIAPVDCREFVGGYYSLGADRHLYVNRGLGNTRRAKREHRPEITVFHLCPMRVQAEMLPVA